MLSMLLYIHMFWVATVILGYSSQELNNDTTLYLFWNISWSKSYWHNSVEGEECCQRMSLGDFLRQLIW